MGHENPSSAKKIRCPQCQAWTKYSADNVYRPFCSERCQVLDLGAWASESFKIAGETATEAENSMQEDEIH